MMKKTFTISTIFILLLAAGALAEEGVRVAGSKLPYIIGGVAAIAIGVLIASKLIKKHFEKANIV